MQPPPSGNPGYKQLQADSNGVKVLHHSWVQSTDVIRNNLPVGIPKSRPITGNPELVGMCQDFQEFQPSKRTVEHCLCVDYAAVKKSSGWNTFWKVTACIGVAAVVVGVVVLTAGAGIAVLGAGGSVAGLAGTAGGVAGTTVAGVGVGVVGVGSAVATASGVGMTLTEIPGDSPDNYEPGAQLGDPYPQDRYGNWVSDGATFTVAVGAPHPC
jgi:hypothetical protein